MKTVLFADAGVLADFPTDGLPEVAVLGRSNVGKSSFVNALVGRKQLARTSGKPGKTRRIHFYRLDDAMYLVDLPGFGYAAVARSERQLWRPMVETYLRRSREPLAGAILLVDIRRGPEVEERELLAWLAAEGIAVRLAITKSDKLKRTQRDRRHAELADALALARPHTACVSSTKRTGLSEVAGWIADWTGFRLQKPDGGPV